MKNVTQMRNLLLFVCAFFLVILWDRKQNVKNPKKILIVQLAKLGDMVCTTPMFRAVKETYPSTRVIVMGDGINQHIVSGNPDIDRYIIFDDKRFFRAVWEVRKEHPDFVAITAPDFGGLLIAIFGGVRAISSFKIYGGKTNETRTYTMLQKFVYSTPYYFGTYVSQALVRLLEPAGIVSDKTKKYLYFTDESKKKIEDIFSSNNIRSRDLVIGISPTAGHRTKEWPADRFAKVADYTSKKYGVKIVIIGGPGDKKEGNAMESALSSGTKFINTVGELNIDELKALISKLDLFMSVDTGPIYIAEAFGVATIDVAGPIDVNEQPPRGAIHKNVVPKSGKKLLFAMNVREYNFDEVRREVESVTPEMVIEKFKELYPLIKNTKHLQS